MRKWLLFSLLANLAAAQGSFAWPDGKRVAVSLTFDDARASQVTNGLDLFSRHGLRATFYVNPRSMVKQVDGWKKIAAAGHEIGNHSDTHPCSGNFQWSRNNALEDYTMARLEEDFAKAEREIEQLVGVKPATFAYPCGSKFIGRGAATQSYVPLIAKRYLAGRGFRDEAANDPEHADFAQLLGIDSDGMPFEKMKDLVERAAPQRGWLVFAGHEIGMPGNQTTEIAELEKFLAWAKDPANGVWVDTVETVARYVQKRRVTAAQAPIDVQRLDGSRLAIRNFAEHRATVLAFLSTRSAESHAAAESLRKLNNQYRRRRVMFVAVFPNAAESGTEIRDFCQAAGFVFPCYRDPEQSAARQLGARVTPEVFVFNPAGAKAYSGNVSGLEAALDDAANDRAVRNASVEPTGAPIGRSGPPLPYPDPHGSISYSSELIFERVPGAAAHHASTMTLAPNGDLLVTWYGGSYESSDDESLYLARRRKGQRNWDRPQLLLQNPEQPVGNAVIFTMGDGSVWIIWGRMESTQPMLAHTGWDTTRLMYRVSKDSGATWSRDREFPMDTAGWLPRNLAITLRDGTVAVPISDERNNRDLSFLLLTKDRGATWRRSADIPNAQPQGEQPAVAQRRDGSLLAFLRTSPRLLQSESMDGGMTWSPAQKSAFLNPDAAISLCALSNGNLLLVWNNTERGRSPLHIARSTDDGKTWSEPLMLESNPGEYSYPSVMQTPDGRIHVIYTYRRYSIKHVEFTEDWLTRFSRPN